MERFLKEIDMKQQTKLREPLDLGKIVYAMAERLKKKDAPDRFYKSYTEN